MGVWTGTCLLFAVLWLVAAVGGQIYRCAPGGVLDWRRAAEWAGGGRADRATRLFVSDCIIPSFSGLAAISQLEELEVLNSEFTSAALPRLNLRRVRFANNPRLEHLTLDRWSPRQQLQELVLSRNENLMFEDYMFDSVRAASNIEIVGGVWPADRVLLFASRSGERLAVERLALEELKLEAMPAEALRHVQVSERLSLAHNNLGELSARAPVAQSYLKALHLSNNYLDLVEADALQTPRLETLDLYRNNLRYLPANAFRACRATLVDLNLGDNFLDSLDAGLLEWPRVRALNLSARLDNETSWRCDCHLLRLLKQVPAAGLMQHVRCFDWVPKAVNDWRTTPRLAEFTESDLCSPEPYTLPLTQKPRATRQPVPHVTAATSGGGGDGSGDGGGERWRTTAKPAGGGDGQRATGSQEKDGSGGGGRSERTRPQHVTGRTDALDGKGLVEGRDCPQLPADVANWWEALEEDARLHRILIGLLVGLVVLLLLFIVLAIVLCICLCLARRRRRRSRAALPSQEWRDVKCVSAPEPALIRESAPPPESAPAAVTHSDPHLSIQLN